MRMDIKDVVRQRYEWRKGNVKFEWWGKKVKEKLAGAKNALRLSLYRTAGWARYGKKGTINTVASGSIRQV
jgi:hypothetical protein